MRMTKGLAFADSRASSIFLTRTQKKCFQRKLIRVLVKTLLPQEINFFSPRQVFCSEKKKHRDTFAPSSKVKLMSTIISTELRKNVEKDEISDKFCSNLISLSNLSAERILSITELNLKSPKWKMCMCVFLLTETMLKYRVKL